MKLKSLSEIFEEVVDGLMSSRTVSDVRAATSKWPSDWANQCKMNEEKKIRERLLFYKEEVEKAFHDPYYKEAYSIYSTPVMKEMLHFFSSSSEIKRRRQRRIISPRKKNLLKDFKFSTTGDENYKAMPFITNAEKINGASACLVWIPNQRIAVWIEAKDRSGLAISKNNIVRFDPDRSFAKRIRKPEELIAVLQKNKKDVFAHLKSVRTVEYEVNGKMNKKYMVVKVW
ncbi:MAG: hypothetical protein N3A54_01265 [Patescibacteria group bacterium]|nr:hypothetical protein [Patescibacteria group bacterium]